MFNGCFPYIPLIGLQSGKDPQHISVHRRNTDLISYRGDRAGSVAPDPGETPQSVRIIGQVFIPGLIGPAIGAFVLRNAAEITNSDGTVSFLPDANIFLAALIVLPVLAVLLRLLERKPGGR